MTLVPFVVVEVVWMDCPSSNGLLVDGLPEARRVEGLRELRERGSRSMTLSPEGYTRTVLVGVVGGGWGLSIFSIGSGRLRTASAGAGTSGLVSIAASRD